MEEEQQRVNMTEDGNRKDRELVDHEYADRGEEPKKTENVQSEQDALGSLGLIPNKFAVRTGVKKRYHYQCSICNAVFTQSWNCVSHMKAHTRIKPEYNCEVCGKKCSKKSELAIHMRIHTGDKPYTCTECGKKFVRQGQLKEHSRRHTGERPFMCIICGMTFTCSSNLKRHCQLHTEGRKRGTARRRGATSEQKVFIRCSPKGSKSEVSCQTDKELTNSEINPAAVLKDEIIEMGTDQVTRSDMVSMTPSLDHNHQGLRIPQTMGGVAGSTTTHVLISQTTKTGSEPVTGSLLSHPVLVMTEESTNSMTVPLLADNVVSQSQVQIDNVTASQLQMQVLNSTAVSLMQTHVGNTLGIPQHWSQSNIDTAKTHQLEQVDNSSAVSLQQTQAVDCMAEAYHQAQTDRGLVISHGQPQPHADNGGMIYQPFQDQQAVTTELKDSATEVRTDIGAVGTSPQSASTVPIDLSALFEEMSASLLQTEPAKQLPKLAPNTGIPSGPMTITVSDPTVDAAAVEKIAVPFQQSESEHSLQAQLRSLLPQLQQQNLPSDHVINIYVADDAPITVLVEDMYPGGVQVDEDFGSAMATAAISRPCTRSHTVLLQQNAHSSAEISDSIGMGLIADKGTLSQHDPNVLKPVKDKPWSCDVCGARFSRNWYLTVHRRTHFKKKVFVCDVCGATFPRISNLNRHKRVHTGEKPFPCGSCSASFPTKYRLVEHLRRHAGVKLYKCEVCGGCFTDSSSLRRHQRTHQGEHLAFTCDVCGAGFNTSHSLTTHLRVHDGEAAADSLGIEVDKEELKALDMPVFPAEKVGEEGTPQIPYVIMRTAGAEGKASYACSVCSRSFHFAATCRQHIMHHTGSRPFRCRQCGAKFARKADAKRHMTIHKKRKPHECLQCGARFPSKLKLAVHSDEHLSPSEKSHECDICPLRFSTGSIVRLHRKMHFGKRGLQQEPGKRQTTDGDKLIDCDKTTENCSLAENDKLSSDNTDKSERTENLVSTHQIEQEKTENSSIAETAFSMEGVGTNKPTTSDDIQTDQKGCEKESSDSNVRKPNRKQKRPTSGQPNQSTNANGRIAEESLTAPVTRRHLPRQASQKLQQLIAAVSELETEMDDEEEAEEMEETSPEQTLPSSQSSDTYGKFFYGGVSLKTGRQKRKKKASGEKDGSMGKKKQYFCQFCPRNFRTAASLRSHKKLHKARHLTCDSCPAKSVGKARKPPNSAPQNSSPKGSTSPNPPPKSSTPQNSSLKQFSHKDSSTPNLSPTASSPLQSSQTESSPKEASQSDADPQSAEACPRRRAPGRLTSVGGKACSQLLKEIRHSLASQGILFRCSVCKKVQDSREALREHLQTHHQCPECGLAYQHACDLAVHMRTHTGERPYHCEVCGYAFVKRAQLKLHLRKHDGKKMLKCDRCGALFSRFIYLTQHAKMHQ